jgi:hypothetical protein
MRLLVSAALSGVVAGAAGQAAAAELKLSVEIPRQAVAEFHKPYVAMYLEGADGAITNLAVWYEVNNQKHEGEKWLKDMRQWWRKSGRDLTMPADGLTSPTRAPGTHELTFDSEKKPVKGLKSGEYTLVVEAAREAGSRELVRIPFQWPIKEAVKASAQGRTELGAISLSINP